MILVPSNARVWLAVGRSDMRKGMNGLALQVQEAVAAGENPHLFDGVFHEPSGAGAQVWWGRSRCKAWPSATAFGGKGLTTLTFHAVLATMRSTARPGSRNWRAGKLDAVILIRILTGVHRSLGSRSPCRRSIRLHAYFAALQRTGNGSGSGYFRR